MLAITGEGSEAFCSGGDLSVFHNLHTEEQAYQMLSKMSAVLFQLFTFPKPTIALLNGTAIGGGCEIATACDFRIACSHVKFGFIQGKLGITTGWGGGTYLLERLDRATALEILLSLQTYLAEQGLGYRFFQKVVKKERAIQQFNEWIFPMIKLSSSVLKAYKKRILDGTDITGLKVRVDREIRECARLWETDEHHEAVKKFLNR
ncbi:enoyl-CoA hydratase/isomerase family protein [Pseudalkalibacillus decolorationis]|uniref:enoyl-CoA hydratase/isomerase family protein n=1 Tax=Pseudalkalibacillus decolorationis TaxID=163879 RepID=UPI002147CA4D|nr:enoyl-CoA hydratase/isomerase family protein [Pseudalkalibacillus decolorationis]